MTVNPYLSKPIYFATIKAEPILKLLRLGRTVTLFRADRRPWRRHA